MAHHFEIKRNKSGEYVAFFKYNSETMFWTEGYSSRASAMNAIESMKKNGPSSPTVITPSVDVDYVDDFIRSADWTGLKSKISQSDLVKIQQKTKALHAAIMQSNIDFDEKINACKRVEAAMVLLESPDVPWREFLQILNHPAVTGFLTFLNIFQLIVGLAS